MESAYVERHLGLPVRARDSPHCFPPPGNQKADALSQIRALATDPSVDTTD